MCATTEMGVPAEDVETEDDDDDDDDDDDAGLAMGVAPEGLGGVVGGALLVAGVVFLSWYALGWV